MKEESGRHGEEHNQISYVRLVSPWLRVRILLSAACLHAPANINVPRYSVYNSILWYAVTCRAEPQNPDLAELGKPRADLGATLGIRLSPTSDCVGVWR